MMLNINAVEAELILDAFQVWKEKLNDELPSLAHKVAGIYVTRRINELISRIEALQNR